MENKQDIIGRKIRKFRESKKITINEVAKKTGFTPSFISQFERGLTKASVSSLQKITSVLHIKLSTLFEESSNNKSSTRSESPVITRKSKRSKLIYPDGQSVDYLLAKTDGQFEMTLSEIEPGGSSGDLLAHENAEEGVTVLLGEMEITIGEKSYVLYAGDTISFSSHIPHGWKNIGSVTLKLIWIVSPPTY